MNAVYSLSAPGFWLLSHNNDNNDDDDKHSAKTNKMFVGFSFRMRPIRRLFPSFMMMNLSFHIL